MGVPMLRPSKSYPIVCQMGARGTEAREGLTRVCGQ